MAVTTRSGHKRKKGKEEVKKKPGGNEGVPNAPGGFTQSASFAGQKEGYVFKQGPQGLGYYVDAMVSWVNSFATSLTQANAQADGDDQKVAKKPKKAQVNRAVPLSVPVNVRLQLEPILKEASHFRDLGKWAISSREAYEIVSNNDSVWRGVARRMKEKEQLMTQTYANEVLLVTAKDLKNTQRRVKQNWYQKYKTSYLFNPVDVLEVAFKKHGGASGLARARKKRAKRKLSIKTNKHKRCDDRRSQLEAAFHSLDPTLEIRSDSRLCEQFISHGEGNPYWIARIMFQMRWFHSTEEYREESQRAYERAQEYARSAYGFAPEEIFDEIVRDRMESAKHRVISAYGRSGRIHEIPAIVLESYPYKPRKNKKNKNN